MATVFYTNSLSPRSAILLSGVCNFGGVYLGGVGVAFAIVHLLPMDLLVDVGSRAGFAMIFAILIAAIVWNVGTWYRGIPASSSHTLIGAIIGVGIANGLIHDAPLFRGLNLGHVEGVFLSLLISPVLGFALGAVLLRSFRTCVRDRQLYETPGDRTPPVWVRSVLVLTSAGVSLAHGSNDGQKGVGLIMIILIGVLPAHFALNPEYNTRGSADVMQSFGRMAKMIEHKQTGVSAEPNAKAPGATYRVVGCSANNSDPISQELEEIAGLVDKHDCLMM